MWSYTAASAKDQQVKTLRGGVEIVVACPGRLLDLLNEKALSLAAVEVLVLDEADHMFDKGFLPDIRRIIKLLPINRQSLVFSATMPGEIRHLAEEILKNPVTVQIAHNQPVPTISHVLFQVATADKTSLLKRIIDEQEMASTLVFTRTKHKAKSLALHLEKAGFSAASLQGNLSQQKRQQALDGFRDGTYKDAGGDRHRRQGHRRLWAYPMSSTTMCRTPPKPIPIAPDGPAGRHGRTGS